MTSGDKEKLRRVLRDVRAGKVRTAMTELCRLAEWDAPVPDPVAARGRALGQLVVQGLAHGIAADTRPARATMPVRAQPKPEPRHDDPDALERFRAAHPTCCLLGCGRKSEVHHMIERSDHGPDDEWNLLPLCGGPTGHHRGREGWHTLTPERFIAVHIAQLRPRDRRKIANALARGPGLKFPKRTVALPERRSRDEQE